jgi:uncharacterized repeat protein (TIGR03803 family)
MSNGASDGTFPAAPLIRGPDGSLYGTTRQGPPVQGPVGPQPGAGAIFKITPQGEFVPLHTFPIYDVTGAEGSLPSYGGLVLRDGALYAMTIQGGAHGLGTVYRLGDDGRFTILHSFDGSDGLYPYGGLILGSDGDFYGTTRGIGGTTGEEPAPPLYRLGSVFKISPRGEFTLLHAFSGQGDDAGPISIMQASDGNFYGTTAGQVNLGFASSHFGSIFRIAADGTFTTLYSFSGGADGEQPVALIEYNGAFYGTTAGYLQNSVSVNGTIFRMTADGKLTTLHSFTGKTDGANPNAGLVIGADGSLYGTTIAGGTAGVGTVFRTTPDGTFSTIYSFTGGADGGQPIAPLLPAALGDRLYGTTGSGGALGKGTVFSVQPLSVR